MFTQISETMFINNTPLWGGYIGKESGKEWWFVEFHDDHISDLVGLPSKEAALDAFNQAIDKQRLHEAMIEVETFCAHETAIMSEWEDAHSITPWRFTTIEMLNGNKYRLGCSSGGIISINGKPFHSNGSHLTTWQQVSDMISNHVNDIPCHQASIFNH